MNLDYSLVPPHRFGELLNQKRTELGLDFQDLIEGSELDISAKYLKKVEHGSKQLTDEQMDQIAQIYGLKLGFGIPEHKILRVDPYSNSIIAERNLIHYQNNDTESILKRYLSLVYLMRGQTPGTAINVRKTDIEVLADSLNMEHQDVENKLNQMIKDKKVELRDYANGLKKQRSIPGAGILVAFLSIGSLVFINNPVAAQSTNTVEIDNKQSRKPIKKEQSNIGDKGFDIIDDPRFYLLNSNLSFGVERLGQNAECLFSKDWKVALNDWNVRYSSSNKEYRGVTDLSRKQITINVNESDSPADVASYLVHQICHAMDLEYFNELIRNDWSDMRQISQPWWPNKKYDYYSLGSSDIAEALVSLWVGAPSKSLHGGFTEENLDYLNNLMASILR